MSRLTALLAVPALLSLSLPSLASSPTTLVPTGQALLAKSNKQKVKLKKFKVAPLKNAKAVKWSHAPYEMGECSICHEKSNPKNPGKVTKPVNELCLECHEQIGEGMKSRKFAHKPATQKCTYCHNPHNASQRMLLHKSTKSLCTGCHTDIGKLAKDSKVKHGALDDGKSCVNCHNPHASNVQNLLISLPFDLCVNCHSKDGMKDSDGKVMTNMKKLLADNPVHHAPVEAKDCSACHQPHGSANFRLLVEPYPEKFYAPYDPKNYALCYSCHNDQIMAKPETTTLTGFRDGKKNLHYKHVHKDDRGRTCRACHEVHASKKPHQLRDGVPYGKGGWVLKLNYKQLPNGGECTKTCHTTKRYKNKR